MRKTMALADDVEDIRDMLKQIVQRFTPSLDVLEFANGQELVAYFENEVYGTRPASVPALVVTDYNMQVMNGLEAARRIRALESQRGASPVPVYVHTARPNEIEQHTEELRLAGILPKPVEMSTLVATLRKYAS